ncbi:MAG: hypothetical protein IPJ41_15855 [Phycisphaerales bacterium]|nr:hypothetical protein [Phycisphaerales bacterium]
MIAVRQGSVSLDFIQGARRPDPARLLTGGSKAKRQVAIASLRAVLNPPVRDLIVASMKSVQAVAEPPHETGDASQ